MTDVTREATAPSRAEIARSVKDRLKSATKTNGMTMNHALAAYAIKGFLRRAAISAHADRWVVKGGNLIFAWTEDARRPTFDLDLESTAIEALTVDELVRIYDDIAAIDIADGLDMSMENKKVLSMTGEGVIGYSIVGQVRLGDSSIKMKLDFGFGDAITPAPSIAHFPSLFRGDDSVQMLTYPVETVIAEKLHAITRFGLENTRLKDYYDLFILSTTMVINGADMSEALRRTFASRNSRRPSQRAIELSGDLDGLSDEFVARWSRQWTSYLKQNSMSCDRTLAEVVAEIRKFAMPLLEAARRGDPLDNWAPTMQLWQSDALIAPAFGVA